MALASVAKATGNVAEARSLWAMVAARPDAPEKWRQKAKLLLDDPGR